MNLTGNAASVNDAIKIQTNEKSMRSDEFNRSYRRWRSNVYEQMLFAGMDDDAEKWLNCGSFPRTKLKNGRAPHPDAETVFVCSSDHEHDAVQFCPTCDNRGCPDCASRMTARFASRFVPKAKEIVEKSSRVFRLRHIVLTTPFSLELPLDELDEKYKASWDAVAAMWEKLQELDSTAVTLGTIESAEFGEDGNKLHFHIIHHGRYIKKNLITQAWSELTDGECEVNWVNGIGVGEDSNIESEIIETIKYSVKFWKRNKEGDVTFVRPDLMPKLMQLLKGTRRVRSRGTFYGIGEQEREPFCCEQCGSDMLRLGTDYYERFRTDKQYAAWVVQLYQETGWTPRQFDYFESLDLTIANKSGEPPPDKPPDKPPDQPQLPIFDNIPGVGINHYQQI